MDHFSTDGSPDKKGQKVKLAIVTGGSRGLGKALVERYLHQGWTVKEFSRSGRSENHIGCDFADAQQTSAVMNQTFAILSQQPWSQIVLINNADIPQAGGIYDVNHYAVTSNE